MSIKEVVTVAGVPVTLQAGAVHWQSGLSVCADGDPFAYHPTNDARALDVLKHAGRPGDWWGVVVDEHGQPVVQGDSDPAPGYYVSRTSLSDATKRQRDPHRYVWASQVPYISVPPVLLKMGVYRGDHALVVYRGTIAPAIVADIGPSTSIGEGSIDLARRLLIPHSAKTGGASAYVTYIIFMGSYALPRWPQTVDAIAEKAHREGDAWVRRIAESGGDIPDALRGPLRGGPCGESPAISTTPPDDTSPPG